MICVSISDKDPQKCFEILNQSEMAEIRLDLCAFNLETVESVFKHSTKTIATCRAEAVGLESQKTQLTAAITAGANYVDIEIETPELQRIDIIELARKHNCTVIISYHNYKETPGLRELYKIVDNCFELGADMAKVATLVNNEKDNARLLSLYSTEGKVVAFGMGEKGKITRIVALKLGAEFSFAASDDGNATAPGQLTHSEMKELIKHIDKAIN